jgi:ABC-type uncharacterized transport system involved in gliding motility auxiliary subunit
MGKLSKLSFLFAFISFASALIVRYLLGEWVPFCWLSLATGLLCLGFGIYKDRLFFKEFFSMKTTKEGMSMGTLILMMLAVLIAVNYLGIRHYKTWDFSVSRSNTLSDQSIKLIKGLKSDLTAVFFYKKGVEGNEENRRMFRELIKKYQDQNPAVKLNFVEVNEQPDLAKEYGVDKGSGVAFLSYKGRRNRIEKIDEQEFTSALVKVTRESNKTLYFTIGHGELKLNESREGLGLGALRTLLEANRYTVKELALSQTPQVPADADVILIVGPSQGFQDFEIQALESYAKKGGSLFIALESQTNTGLNKLLEKVGVQFANNYIFNIVDTVMGKGVNQGPTMGAVFSPENQITKGFGKGEVTLYRNPQGLLRGAIPVGVVIDDLVKTTPESMAFPSLKIQADGPTGSFVLVEQVKGRWPGVSSEAKEFNSIVAGDADFLSNQMLYQNMNRDLVLNSVATLAKEEDLISITPKEAQATTLMLTETKFALFLFGFVIPLPLLLLGTSIGLYLRRRNA